MANITYYLGAGASYHSVPIQNALGDKMFDYFELKYFPRSFEKGEYRKPYDFDKIKIETLPPERVVFRNISFFGQKALEYGSIDTYAKKLWLNQPHNNIELDLLKSSVNHFFTIWQKVDRELWKKGSALPSGLYTDIDSRYITLLASILEKNSNGPYLPSNINFITWNYDLQIEYAFSKFLLSKNWSEIEKRLHFLPTPDSEGPRLQICHLNGLSGYYLSSNKHRRILGSDDSMSFDALINTLTELNQSDSRGEKDLSGVINYAWEEDNPFVTRVRNDAIHILEQTDVLVIIGYSFPPFNRASDRMLFKNLGEGCRIVNQCPGAKKEIFKSVLGERFNPDNVELVEEVDKFHLPDDFFSGSSEQ